MGSSGRAVEPAELEQAILRESQTQDRRSQSAYMCPSVSSYLKSPAREIESVFWYTKTQAIHAGTGFTLRRFNTDISKGLFEVLLLDIIRIVQRLN
jgi:hypothetical protein